MKNLVSKLLITLSCFAFLGTLLSGCDSTKKANADKEILSIMQNYAQALSGEVSEITTGSFEWYNSSEYEAYDGRDAYMITGYYFMASGVSKSPDVADYFDGWTINYIGDGFRSSSTEIIKDRWLCLYDSYLEQDIPEELIFGYSDENTDEENERIDQLWEDFYAKVTYTMEVSCGKLPEQALLLRDFNYDLYGTKNFDDGTIRGGNLYLFENEMKKDDLYFDHVVSEEKSISLRNYKGEVGSIDNKSCIDKNQKKHDYTFKFYWDNNGIVNFYEGCADKVDFDFTVTEQGTIDTLIKKTGYKYQGNENHKRVSYYIDNVMKNYVTATIYDFDQDDYDAYNVLLEKTPQGRKTLFEGAGYSIDPEKCEELFQHDHEITEFSFLLTCPRG